MYDVTCRCIFFRTIVIARINFSTISLTFITVDVWSIHAELTNIYATTKVVLVTKGICNCCISLSRNICISTLLTYSLMNSTTNMQWLLFYTYWQQLTVSYNTFRLRCERTQVRISPRLVAFITTVTVIYSLGHGLCTLTAVLRSTQPSNAHASNPYVMIGKHFYKKNQLQYYLLRLKATNLGNNFCYRLLWPLSNYPDHNRPLHTRIRE